MTRCAGGNDRDSRTRRRSPARRAVWPGLKGGRYCPLSEHEVERVHQTVLNVLENIGMGNPIPALRENALRRGCRINEHGRLCFPRGLVEDVIATSPKQLHYLGQDPRHDLVLGGQAVHTYGGGDAVNILDVGADKYRPSTLLDVYDLARLVDRMENIHAFSRLVVATEFTNQLECDLNIAYASAAGTAKHTGLSFANARHVQPTLQMLHVMAGGEAKFRERPFMHGGGCPVTSPLQYGTENSEVCLESTKFNAPVWIVVAPLAGATAPTALAGALVQAVAEALAGLLLVDMVHPRHPVMLGAWPFICDLRSGSFSGGGGEEALVSAAAAQLINYYGLASSTGAGMTDSKLPDNQAGFEKGIAITLAAQAGCTNVSESAGMLGSLMAASTEALVIDNDMLGAVLRTVRGIEINDETLSYDVIREVVHNEGHYLRHAQTLRLMRSEYHYPELSDRSVPGEWEAGGSQDIRTRAAERVKAILSTHYPEYIDPQIDRKIRDRFPIRLSRDAMQPGNGRWC